MDVSGATRGRGRVVPKGGKSQQSSSTMNIKHQQQQQGNNNRGGGGSSSSSYVVPFARSSASRGEELDQLIPTKIQEVGAVVSSSAVTTTGGVSSALSPRSASRRSTLTSTYEMRRTNSGSSISSSSGGGMMMSHNNNSAVVNSAISSAVLPPPLSSKENTTTGSLITMPQWWQQQQRNNSSKSLLRTLVLWILLLSLIALGLNILAGFAMGSNHMASSEPKPAPPNAEYTTTTTTTTTSISPPVTTTTTTTTTTDGSTGTTTTTTGTTILQRPPIQQQYDYTKLMNGSYNGSNTGGLWLNIDPTTVTPYQLPTDSTSSSSNNNNNNANSFTDTWCDLHTGNVEWYPNGAKTSWQQRAPAVLIPGAKYGGTAALSAALHKHPDIIEPTGRQAEIAFFFEPSFRRYVNYITEKTSVFQARERMYAREYDKTQLIQHPEKIAIDATPGYLFYSSIIPRRLLCVIPWVKMIIVLQNPIHRIISHYIAAQKRGLKIDFDTWIEKDFKVMRDVGLIQNWTDDTTITTGSSSSSSSSDGTSRERFTRNRRRRILVEGDDNNNNNIDEQQEKPTSFLEFSGSEYEDISWDDYLAQTLEGIIGRSMYEIQLRQWFAALEMINRNPSSEVLIVLNEALVANPVMEYERIIRFLNLQPQQQDQTSSEKAIKALLQTLDITNSGGNNNNGNGEDSTTTTRTTTQSSLDAMIEPHVRQKLETFFQPYNMLLENLLRRYGLSTRA